MKREGIKPYRPYRHQSKTDYHPRDGWVNWWENLGMEEGHETQKQHIQDEIDQGIEEYEEKEENDNPRKV